MMVGVLGLLMIVQLGAPAGAASPGAAAVRTADGAILGAIGARDANLIEAATLATEKAWSVAVRRFATDVLRDHQRSLTRGAHLAARLQVTRLLPADSAMVRTQRAQMALLDSLSGAAFDGAFIQFVVDDHASALLQVARSHLPQARHAEVAALLRERLPALRAHHVVGQAWLAEATRRRDDK